MSRGRPREFDTDDALDEAIEVFWSRGYEGTTLDDLTSAMGISRPSLYAAFGNKEQTFARALSRYATVDMAYVQDAIAEPTARGMARHYLHSNVDAITTPGRPPGCLSVQAGLAGTPADQSIIQLLQDSRAGGEAALARRIQRGIDDGEFDATADAADLAKYLATVSAGLAVQASSGASAEDLHRVVDRALLAFG